MNVDLVHTESLPAHHARWQLVHDLFERLRQTPRSTWHAELNAVVPEDPALAYEVLSLLVADESVERAQIDV